MNNYSRQRIVRPTPTSLPRRLRASVAKLAVGRSLREFQPLLPGEERLLQACQRGEIASLGTQVPEASNDELHVRGPFLRFLLLGGDQQAPVHERGVHLKGALVKGQLDLGGCRIPHNINLEHCRFTDGFFILDARVQGLITLEGSVMPQGIIADRLQCDGGLFLRNVKATGEVRLLGVRIGGDLAFSGGQFEVKDGNSLSVDGAVVKGGVFLDEGFKAMGEVRLLGVQIGGNLACSGGQFEVKEGDALSADRVVVKGGVFFDEGFKATGKVRLLGAQIGDLYCSGGQFEVEDVDAILSDRVAVKGSVFFNNGFKATGRVRLLGAQIGGNLACSEGRFEVKGGDALSADRVVVKGGVFFNNGFKATGEVRLLGAQIGGDLACSGGQFEVKDGYALSADGAVVKGSVFFNNGFKATGNVRLLGLQIGRNLECSGGQFEAKDGYAFSADRAIVDGAWLFRELQQAVRVNASHMQVAVLVDEIDSWAKGSVLDGLHYGAFGGDAPTQAEARQNWLSKQSDKYLGESKDGKDFRPHPWRHLQHVMREMGHMEDARQIGIAFEQQLRKVDLIGTTASRTNKFVAYGKRKIARASHALFGWLAGYGYRPMRLVFNMLVVWLICGIAYWFLALPPNDAIGPSDPLVFQNERYATCVPGNPAAVLAKANGERYAGNWYLCKPLPAEYATFSPLVYSLDIILPLVDLGQEKAWGPLIATPNPIAWEELSVLSQGHFVRFLIWFETLFGWVGSLLLVGIVSGFARRTEE